MRDGESFSSCKASTRGRASASMAAREEVVAKMYRLGSRQALSNADASSNGCVSARERSQLG